MLTTHDSIGHLKTSAYGAESEWKRSMLPAQCWKNAMPSSMNPALKLPGHLSELIDYSKEAPYLFLLPLSHNPLQASKGTRCNKQNISGINRRILSFHPAACCLILDHDIGTFQQLQQSLLDTFTTHVS